MGVLKTVLIASMLFISAFVLTQGFGAEFGLLQEAQVFSERFPSSSECDWNETRDFENARVDDECVLRIDDMSSSYDSLNVERFPYTSTEQEFKDGQQDTEDVEYKNDSIGDYITPDGDLEYRTNNFYAQPGETGDAELYVEYSYLEEEAPSSAEIVLWDVESGNEEDSVTLTPGSEGDDYLENTSLSVSNEGQYHLRLQIDGDAEDEQKIYSLEAWQKGDDLETFASGYYESQRLQRSDQTIIELMEYDGVDIQNRVDNPEQRVKLTVNGYLEGEEVATEEFYVGNSFDVQNDLFEGTSHEEFVETDSFNFEAELISETSDSPGLVYTLFEGETSDRIASQEVSDFLQTLLFLILTGFALVLLGREFF